MKKKVKCNHVVRQIPLTGKKFCILCGKEIANRQYIIQIGGSVMRYFILSVVLIFVTYGLSLGVMSVEHHAKNSGSFNYVVYTMPDIPDIKWLKVALDGKFLESPYLISDAIAGSKMRAEIPYRSKPYTVTIIFMDGNNQELLTMSYVVK